MNKDLPGGQLALLFSHAQISLQRHFEQYLAKPVSLIVTQNSTSMLSLRERDGRLIIRLHRIFISAGADVIEEISRFLKNKRGKMPLFRRFIRENGEQLTVKPPNKVQIKTAGRFHDLRLLYDEINQHYFAGGINSAITWGTGSSGSVRKRTLGSFSERSNTIRINPVLDRKTVPRFYVSFVIYHEMLHSAIGISRKGKRRSVHSREFREREKLFREYEKAREWERGKA